MPLAAMLTGLFTYPVKGCAGIALDEAELTPRGLAHDRRWMIVTEAGRFQSQRELPRLAVLRPYLVENELRLAMGSAGEVAVPLLDVGEPCRVVVWRDEVAALAVDSGVDQALSAWLGKPVRLVRFPEQSQRPCDPKFAPAGSHTGFADGFPLLVTNEASLADLNAALEAVAAAPVPMSRFRPNVVLAGLPSGAEDRCRMLDFGPAFALNLVKRCDRCVVTTIDQATGTRTGKEPLATLMRVRRNDRTGGAWFGQNAVAWLPGRDSATLRLGDRCTLRDGGEAMRLFATEP